MSVHIHTESITFLLKWTYSWYTAAIILNRAQRENNEYNAGVTIRKRRWIYLRCTGSQNNKNAAKDNTDIMIALGWSDE